MYLRTLNTVFLAITCLSWPSAQVQPLQDAPRQKISEDATFQLGNLPSSEGPVELCVVEADRSAIDLRVLSVNKGGDSSEIYEHSTPKGSVASMTGTYYGYDAKRNYIPLGLAISNGNKLSPKHPWKTGGVALSSTTGASIVPIAEFTGAAAISDAAQSMYLLVDKGKATGQSAGKRRYDQGAIAISSDDRVLFVVVTAPNRHAATLPELTDILLRLKTTGGGHVVTALAMDGGPSTHLYVPALDSHCGSGPTEFVPNVLYLAPRSGHER